MRDCRFFRCVADYWGDASCEIEKSGALFASAAAAAPLGHGSDTTDDSVRLITQKDDSASVEQHPSSNHETSITLLLKNLKLGFGGLQRH